MIKLEHGDCLRLMKKIPNKSIDMILADLPYGITKAKWDSVIPLKPLWKQYNRIIKDHGCIALFGNEPFSSNLRISNLRKYRYDWIWQKSHATGFLLCHKMPMKDYENISIFYKHLPKYNPQMRIGATHQNGRGNGISIRTSNNTFAGGGLPYGKTRKTNKYFPVRIIRFSGCEYHQHHYHPTQKPVSLLKYLVKTYTNKGDLVLDNVMGSGSTGVACKQLHRNFIGMEINDHYFNVAKKRIEKS